MGFCEPLDAPPIPNETPLDRNLREVREAYATWEATVRACRDGGASREDVMRNVIALKVLIDELGDLMPYAENA